MWLMKQWHSINAYSAFSKWRNKSFLTHITWHSIESVTWASWRSSRSRFHCQPPSCCHPAWGCQASASSSTPPRHLHPGTLDVACRHLSRTRKRRKKAPWIRSDRGRIRTTSSGFPLAGSEHWIKHMLVHNSKYSVQYSTLVYAALWHYMISTVQTTTQYMNIIYKEWSIS